MENENQNNDLAPILERIMAGEADMKELAQPIELGAPVTAALEAFKASNPWQGKEFERESKFRTLHEALCRAADVGAELVIQISRPYSDSGRSHFNAQERKLYLVGRYSVITYLTMFAASMGKHPLVATSWAYSVYKKFWPEKWEALAFENGTLKKRA